MQDEPGRFSGGMSYKGTAFTDYTDDQILTLLNTGKEENEKYTEEDLYVNLGMPSAAITEVKVLGTAFEGNKILEVSFGNNAMYQAVVWKMSGEGLLVNKAVLYASLLKGKGFEINGQDYAFEYDVTAEATEITLTTQQGSVPETTGGEGEKTSWNVTLGSGDVGYYSTYEGKAGTDAIVTVSEWTMADTSKGVIPTVVCMKGDASLVSWLSNAYTKVVGTGVIIPESGKAKTYTIEFNITNSEASQGQEG